MEKFTLLPPTEKFKEEFPMYTDHEAWMNIDLATLVRQRMLSDPDDKEDQEKFEIAVKYYLGFFKIGLTVEEIYDKYSKIPEELYQTLVERVGAEMRNIRENISEY